MSDEPINPLATTDRERKRHIGQLKRELSEALQTVDAYATAARVIALHLKDHCDESLPYDQMIAEASRRAGTALASTQAQLRELREALETVAERATRARSSGNGWAYQFQRFGNEIAIDIRAALNPSRPNTGDKES